MDRWWCVRRFPPSHPGWSWLLTPGRRAVHPWSQYPAGRHGMPGPTPSALVEAGVSEEASWDHEHFNEDKHFPLSCFLMSIPLISILWQKVLLFAQKISFKKKFLMFSFPKRNQHFLCPPSSHPLSPSLLLLSPFLGSLSCSRAVTGGWELCRVTDLPPQSCGPWEVGDFLHFSWHYSCSCLLMHDILI